MSKFNYIYKLGYKQKELIPFLISNGKTEQYICDRFGLSKKFVVNYFKDLFMLQKTNLGAKLDSYYINEMDYGKIPSYKWEDLSESEIKFYHDFNK